MSMLPDLTHLLALLPFGFLVPVNRQAGRIWLAKLRFRGWRNLGLEIEL